MRADLGGTSGGPLPDRSSEADDCLFNRCEDAEGMTSGVRVLGESGCFGDFEREWAFDGVADLEGARSVLAGWKTPLPNNNSVSAFSSSRGPEIHDSILSPKTCCRQLLPGALIDRS
jgi:hypothetical protein